MIATVVGSRHLDFVDQSGKRVVGLQLFVVYPEDGVEGSKTDKVFISEELCSSLPVFEFGTAYKFNYDTVGFGRRAKNRLVSVEEA